MSINYAILGMLSYKSLTGYDLKKLMQDSPFMPWSGNNNQIYKALVELLEGGLVSNEVLHQVSAPSKKIYSITEKGLAQLKEWGLSIPEAPEIKNVFLVQLAWSFQLERKEFSGLIDEYERLVKMQAALGQSARGKLFPSRTLREELVWEMIYENMSGYYASELEWIARLRQRIEETEE